WSKNLARIRFGRLSKRTEEGQWTRMMKAFEEMTGSKFPDHLWKSMARGSDELDLVRSGLDDRMREALQEIREPRQRPGAPGLPPAAFCVAIEKIATSYRQLGVWP